MKTIVYTLLFLFVGLSIAEAGGDPIKQFYRKFKRKENVQKLALPGVVVRTGVGLARLFVREREAKAGLKLARKIKGIRFLADESGQHITHQDCRQLIQDLQNKKHRKMEVLLMFREGKELVYIMGRINKKKKIKQLLILNKDGDEFTMVALKTRLKIKDLNELLRTVNEGDDIQIDIPEINRPVVMVN